MLKVPKDIWDRFDALLASKAIPDKYRNHYMKWLRYYLDFCQKYDLSHADRSSLPRFIEKLQEKRQTQQQQRQASHAVSFYYRLLQTGSNSETQAPQPSFSQKLHEKVTHSLIPSRQGRVAIAGRASPNASGNNRGKVIIPQRDCWRALYDALHDEIKIRHYSPKTLKTYAMWTRKFQTFLKNKDTQSLSSQDVKEFLTFLAVSKKVSASTQNQAFLSAISCKL